MTYIQTGRHPLRVGVQQRLDLVHIFDAPGGVGLEYHVFPSQAGQQLTTRSELLRGCKHLFPVQPVLLLVGHRSAFCEPGCLTLPVSRLTAWRDLLHPQQISFRERGASWTIM